MSTFSAILLAASLASVALAKTDLSGCTSTDVSSPAGASVAYYVPGTGEICSFLDCGGGRAPPKYSVPGCPQYTGTASYSPSYLAGYGSMTAAPSATSSASQVSGSSSAAVAPVSSSSSAGSMSSNASESASASQAHASEVSSSAVATPSMYTSTGAHTTTVVISTPAAVGGSNGTIGSGTTGSGASSSNGTHGTSPTPSGLYNSGAEKVWIGSAAILGLGALVAVL
ncbi:hypothetical protein DOTSEDRAFT_62659 [Dothistroma septosporum NZE10]|uniref:Uncharacterized protein n=1 Tax=Dothistroma septosporum (strain NZE10 / CBS 128990) TaxID=675120 RepID=N1PP64_DOTSN|nr:hypothetical protein DOTSEDRAFT_62659 [Dothistroma septosporum NZE10]